MDEHAARGWLRNTLNVSRETEERMGMFVELLGVEALRQNLISATTADAIFSRHVVDSAQILLHMSQPAGALLDLGSGAGLPGVVLAILTGCPTVLIESRRLRSDWLRRVVDALDLRDVTVVAQRVESAPTYAAATITARAFAPLSRLLPLAYRFSNPKTRWVLPKGRTAPEELASVADTWHGAFTLVPSVTDASSAIIVAHDVRPREMGKRR